MHRLLHEGDPFFVLADLESYILSHERIASLYTQQDAWVKKSIYNVGGMGFFSSDRAIAQYAKEIWNIPRSN